ncbi:MAG TPA: isoprenylcysteine carboxylmethyltransferase family protein [bacterium]|nr:isoprenylcysteine carboxylmethyltransferase family protein [bacterium]
MTARRSSRWRGTRGEGWVVLQVVLLAAVAALPPAGGKVVSAPTAAASVALIGMIMLVAGVVALGSNLSVLPSPREGARVVRHGVYRWVRHPIYVGVILLTVGWAVYRGDLLHVVMAVVIGVFYAAKASREERYLQERFPDYKGYRRRTWRFVPWVY